jgi:hypothetical protein
MPGSGQRLAAWQASSPSTLALVVALACTYELRDRSGVILSTGRITLEQRPVVGQAIRLGTKRTFVLDLQPATDGLHLVLEPLQ